jgi:lysyl-tRNA synthetase class 2
LKKSWLNPYPNDFKPDSTAERLFKSYGELPKEELEKTEKVFRLAGRIVALRSFGKATFMHIQDRTGKIQLYFQQQIIGEDKYKNLMEIVETGDIIGVEGTLFKTRTGEFTVKVTSAKILVKSLMPLPEKWHGLQDVEIRYRQRYVDLIANPEVKKLFITRSKIIKKIREFLDSLGFIEVETPMMQPIPGGAAARPFITHHNALDMDLYLRIAPELYLKRLVVGGLERVYEINRNFRNEGVSTMHNPEFTMLEFYMSYATYEDLMDLTESMVKEIARDVLGKMVINFNGVEFDLSKKWRRVSFYEVLEEYSGVKKESFNDVEFLSKKLAELGVKVLKGWGTGKLLLEIFEQTAEDKLIEPTFVYGYPLEVSPLARKNDKDNSIVDRFELYIGGMEIANAFSELNDPLDQKERFAAQMKAREMGDEEAQVMDSDYIRALEYGLPPTAGEGIGIDRLVMLLTGSKSIREVILFPLLRPERE